MGVIALPELPWRKIFGTAAVIVLHIAIVVVLLNATIIKGIFKPAPRETILYLRPPPKPQVKLPAKPVVPPVRKTAPVAKLQSRPSSTVPNAAAPAEVSGPASQGLDCRAANLPKLTDEQRAACAKAAVGPKQDNSDVDYADHSGEIPGAARWAREKQRKNAPPLLPCASNQSIYATASTATLLCLAKGAINGFDPDSIPSYGDKPEEEPHTPNGAGPPPTFTAPDH
jgi:hypothetical protein